MGLMTGENPKSFAHEHFPSAHATFLQAAILPKAPAKALRSLSERMRKDVSAVLCHFAIMNLMPKRCPQ